MTLKKMMFPEGVSPAMYAYTVLPCGYLLLHLASAEAQAQSGCVPVMASTYAQDTDAATCREIIREHILHGPGHCDAKKEECQT